MFVAVLCRCEKVIIFLYLICDQMNTVSYSSTSRATMSRNIKLYENEKLKYCNCNCKKIQDLAAPQDI